MIGQRIGHYTITDEIGKGGMGEVWLAEDSRLKRKVALKLLRAELTSDAERVRRLEKETQAASALDHPNIITVMALEATVDFWDWLSGPVLELLEEREYFARFFVDGGTVGWPNGADIAPETLHECASEIRGLHG